MRTYDGEGVQSFQNLRGSDAAPIVAWNYDQAKDPSDHDGGCTYPTRIHRDPGLDDGGQWIQ